DLLAVAQVADGVPLRNQPKETLAHPKVVFDDDMGQVVMRQLETHLGRARRAICAHAHEPAACAPLFHLDPHDQRLDTLFLALPASWKGTLAQYAGRLHRLRPGKTTVQVFDYVDNAVPMLARMFEKRLRTYRALGYLREEAEEVLRPTEIEVEYDDDA